MSTDHPAFFPMTFGDWVTYSSYISHAFDLDEEDLISGEIEEIEKLLAFANITLRFHARSGG
ncbi:MAG: hypothetical protein AAGA09_00215 [Pseudomonadota bacterium]